MKKILMLVALTALMITASGCMSARTPATGKNRNLNYYMTFFGMSFESAIYGDGFIVNPTSNK